MLLKDFFLFTTSLVNGQISRWTDEWDWGQLHKAQAEDLVGVWFGYIQAHPESQQLHKLAYKLVSLATDLIYFMFIESFQDSLYVIAYWYHLLVLNVNMAPTPRNCGSYGLVLALSEAINA